MKEYIGSLGKWVVAGLLLAAIGALMMTGAGRRRGTKAYGWRIALWGLAVALMGGAPFVSGQASASQKGWKADASVSGEVDDQDDPRPRCYRPMPQPTCYKPMPPPQDPSDEDEADQEPQPVPGDIKTCYAPVPPPTCYEPMPVPSCYEPMPDNPPPPPPDDPQPTCYAPVPDPDPPPPVPTCYSAMPPEG